MKSASYSFTKCFPSLCNHHLLYSFPMTRSFYLYRDVCHPSAFSQVLYDTYIACEVIRDQLVLLSHRQYRSARLTNEIVSFIPFH